MLVVTLMCNPAAPCLEAVLVENLRNAWGGGDAVWLMPDVAAEFSLENNPDNFWDIWTDFQDMGVDMVIQPLEGRRKTLLLADMDSTMIEQECIDELADAAEIGAGVAEITAIAMNGGMPFDDALRKRVGLLKGKSLALIDTVLAERITYMPGAKELVSTMRANGGYAALVSGGFTVFTGPVASYLGMDEHRSNTFEVVDGMFTGNVVPPIFGREAKVQALEEITAKLDISDADVIAVGDGANDLGMLTRAGTGVALHAKPVVQEQVSIRVNHCDLRALLFVQGYDVGDFR
ncbi:MAG: phosphoserine phosphatase SerB [Litoreibacter sp.]